MASLATSRWLVVYLVWAAVAALAVISIRAQAGGPDWRVELGESREDGTAAVRAVDPVGTGWGYGLRPGLRVLRVGEEDASRFAGRALPPVATVTYEDARGGVQVARPVSSPVVILVHLVTAAVYAALGGVVYRWSPDIALGGRFLFFTGAWAIGLASMPFGPTRTLWAQLWMNGVVSVVSPAAFLALVYHFPRPLKGGSQIERWLAVLTGMMVVGSIASQLARASPSWVDIVVKGWEAGAFLAGVGLLGVRAINSNERRYALPVLLGFLAVLLPYLALVRVPQLVIGSPIVAAQLTALSGIAVPIAFTYVILRHSFLGLVVAVRVGISRFCAAMATVAGFALAWAGLRHLGTDPYLGGLAAAGIIALLAPAIWSQIHALLDRWVYPFIDPSLSNGRSGASESVTDLAQALVWQVLLVVPVRWVACYVRGHSPRGLMPDGPWLLALMEGPLPPPTIADFFGEAEEPFPPGTAVVDVEQAGLVVARLVVGPRIDGASVEKADLEVIARYGKSAALLLEVALRRAWAADGVDAHGAHQAAGGDAHQGRSTGGGTGAGVRWPYSPPTGAASPVKYLTRREKEIALLLARGLTNRQIANHLLIAEGTAAKHVENILAKLGYQSRAQVAVWAVENGLASDLENNTQNCV